MFYLFLANTLMRQVSPLPAGASEPWLEEGRLDDWRLLRAIGGGGCGDVFLAENAEGVRRALKVFSPTVEDRRAFDLEYDGLGWAKRLRGHPNLVPIESVGRTAHCVYYTMPLADPLDGGDYEPHILSSRIKRDDLTEEELLEIAASVLSALDFLHRNGLVYRDVKPENIMRFDGVWCLGDPGLISTRRPRQFAGTPGFYPNRRNFRADTADDIYALGKTLYLAATGMKISPDRYPEVYKHYDYDRYSTLRRIYRTAVEGGYNSADEMRKDVVSAQKKLKRDASSE